jgi:hypothetical protein
MTERRAKAFVAELKNLCIKHEVVLLGSCINEGTYGEISIRDRPKDSLIPRADGDVYENDGEFVVDGV